MRIVVTGGGPEGRRPGPALPELLLSLPVNAAGLWIASAVVTGIRIDDAPSLVAGAALLSLVHALVRPLAYLATACVILLTLGLFVVVVNALMLALTAWLAGQLGLGFRVDGFAAALLGALVVSALSHLATRALRRAARGRRAP